MTATSAQSAPDKAGKAATPAAPKHCGCLTGTGKTCDRTTQKAFAQGHDARMASRLAQAVADPNDQMTIDKARELIQEAGGSDLLIGKMAHSAGLRKAKASGQSASKPAKSTSAKGEAKGQQHARADDAQARAVASAGSQLLGSKVKVKHGSKEYDAVVVRDASNQVVARHRLTGKNCDHSVTDEGVTGETV